MFGDSSISKKILPESLYRDGNVLNLGEFEPEVQATSDVSPGNKNVRLC